MLSASAIRRLVKFGIVGVSGIGVNMGMLAFLHRFLGIHYMPASAVAIEVSILTNYIANSLWTWSDRDHKIHHFLPFARYHLAAGVSGFFGNFLILVGLKELFGINVYFANFVGIAVGSGINYFLNDRWTFRKRNDIVQS